MNESKSFVAWHEVACPAVQMGAGSCDWQVIPWAEDCEGRPTEWASMCMREGRRDLLAAFGGQSCEGAYEDFVEWRGLYWEGAECGPPRLETLAAGVIEKVVGSWLKYEQAEEDRFEKEKPLMRRSRFEQVVFGREVQGLLARALPGAAPTSVESGLVVFDEWHRGYAKAGGCEYDEECWPKGECVVAWAKSVAEFRFQAEAPVKCRTEALPVSEADRAEYLERLQSAMESGTVECRPKDPLEVVDGYLFVKRVNANRSRVYANLLCRSVRLPTPEATSLLAAKGEVRVRWCAKRAETVKLECRRCPWCAVERGGGPSACLVTGTRAELAECKRDLRGRRASR